jgi:hypothetical protein
MTEDWDDLCDEERSFNEWLARNDSAINISVEKIMSLYKEIYMHGYAAGFLDRQKINAMEQLQK